MLHESAPPSPSAADYAATQSAPPPLDSAQDPLALFSAWLAEAYGAEPNDPNAMTLLRDDLGYDGVAVTDELAEMGAITQRGISVPDAVERALIAGNDMALYFGDAKQLGDVLDQLEEAVSVGRLSMERVDQSLTRVITLKASGGCSV